MTEYVFRVLEGRVLSKHPNIVRVQNKQRSANLYVRCA